MSPGAEIWHLNKSHRYLALVKISEKSELVRIWVTWPD